MLLMPFPSTLPSIATFAGCKIALEANNWATDVYGITRWRNYVGQHFLQTNDIQKPTVTANSFATNVDGCTGDDNNDTLAVPAGSDITINNGSGEFSIFLVFKFLNGRTFPGIFGDYARTQYLYWNDGTNGMQWVDPGGTTRNFAGGSDLNSTTTTLWEFHRSSAGTIYWYVDGVSKDSETSAGSPWKIGAILSTGANGYNGSAHIWGSFYVYSEDYSPVTDPTTNTAIRSYLDSRYVIPGV